jgi:hypothetical protein
MDLAGVPGSLAVPSNNLPPLDKKGRPINWEGAITKFACGLAFLTIAIALGVTNMAGGRVWWFWMLIPAFTMIGSGVAQYMQLRGRAPMTMSSAPEGKVSQVGAAGHSALGPQSTQFVQPESRYKTGDLVPPSVTDGTTRHLELDREGETTPLRKS